MILITGFPHTGTSFLANLIVEMGFSPGPEEHMQPADEDNRFGYWEHMRLKRLVRRLDIGFNKAWFYKKMCVLRLPPRDHPTANTIREKLNVEGIEVFKDNYIPVTYTLFPRNCKCIVMRRDRSYIYQTRVRAGHEALSYKDFVCAYTLYDRLVERMSAELPTLIVQYEDFYGGFDGELKRISDFLGLDFEALDIKRLRAVFRPRKRREL